MGMAYYEIRMVHL